MAARDPYPGGWRALALLFLLVPLVQGGTPRLPAAATAVTLTGAFGVFAWGWRRGSRRTLQLGAVDALLALLLFWGLASLLTAPYYHAAEQAVVPLLSFAAG